MVRQVSIRALDNVLDATLWPLLGRREEARNKRRVGLGFTGMGNTLTMLNLRYDSEAGRAWLPTSRVQCATAPTALRRKSPRRRAAFPLFDAEQFLAEPHCASRLPEDIKAGRSASTVCATRTCCRSPRPERSRSRSPPMPRAASSRRFPGPTCARSACPTAASRSTRSRTMPTACTATWAAT